jgi:hypothetical protein
MTVRRPVRFTKRDLVRAVEAIRAAGLPIASIRIEPDGAILVVPGTAAQEIGSRGRAALDAADLL